MLEKTEEAMRNKQSRDTWQTHCEEKQNKNHNTEN